jgi:predicted ABC-type ATPase
MAPPVLWLIAGPNGAGKSTYYEGFVAPLFRAPFVNADQKQLLAAGESFVAETVFSHPSELELMRKALMTTRIALCCATSWAGCARGIHRYRAG